jgi:cysteine desulfurase family protein (TIGR01976 family)
MGFDVAAVRTHFPALSTGVAYFDGPGGSQVPRQVADAVAATLTAGISNRGPLTVASRLADSVVADARSAMADLLGATAAGIVFGRSMTALTYDLSRTLAKSWRDGDEVVVTGLDHDANIRPWIQAAAATGAQVRVAEPDPVTGELTVAAVAAALTDRTRVVAVTGASNLIGTRPDLPGIAAVVHATGALFVVDGVHLTPHAPVDVTTLGADVYLCSPYKFLGPHCGVLAASPGFLETLHPDKLRPSTDDVPERFELGTLPYELLAGTTAAVDFLAALTPEQPRRRSRILASMAAVEAHEALLFGRLLDGLRAVERVRLIGSPAVRTPTVLFTVEGVDSLEVSTQLAAVGVNAPAGSFYAIEAAERLGPGAAGGVRAGLAPYTDAADVDRLLAAVTDIAAR